MIFNINKKIFKFLDKNMDNIIAKIYLYYCYDSKFKKEQDNVFIIYLLRNKYYNIFYYLAKNNKIYCWNNEFHLKIKNILLKTNKELFYKKARLEHSMSSFLNVYANQLIEKENKLIINLFFLIKKKKITEDRQYCFNLIVHKLANSDLSETSSLLFYKYIINNLNKNELNYLYANILKSVRFEGEKSHINIIIKKIKILFENNLYKKINYSYWLEIAMYNNQSTLYDFYKNHHFIKNKIDIKIIKKYLLYLEEDNKKRLLYKIELDLLNTLNEDVLYIENKALINKKIKYF